MLNKTVSSTFRLIAAPFTPFHQHHSVNLEIIPSYFDQLRGSGVAGAFVCGTTGEWASLTKSERLAVLEAWIEARGSDSDFEIFVHAGHECLGEAREIAAHAASFGADAVAALAPSFFTPTTIDQAVDHAARVAEAANGVPFYYYHLPSMTGMNLSMVRFLEAARPAIPNLRGLKFTHHDLGDYHDCLREFGDDLDILFGRDELLLEAMVVGARGAVGSTYNFAAPLYQEMADELFSGRLEAAAACQGRARSIISSALSSGGLAGLKAVMSAVGVDCGPCRPPLAVLSTEEVASVRNGVAGFGVVRPVPPPAAAVLEPGH